MSTTIDERVVSLQFDNKEFEQNVQVSLTTLDKLKESLKFGDETTKTFENIEDASKKVKLSGLTNILHKVQAEFSALDMVTVNVFSNMANKAIAKGTSLATAGFRQIITGGINRAKNLEKADFMLKGIFKDDPSGKKAELVMKNVGDAVSGTAYGLDEAAVIASQFAASGVEGGQQMEDALKGVAGVAAMTSSSFSDIGNIFAKVASSGRVMGDEFNQLSARGINVTATLAEQLHKTEDEILEMRKKGEINFEMFSNAMTAAFGDQAKKAEETYEGAVSNMKAALSRIGAEVATPGLENLRIMALSLRDLFNTIHIIIMPVIDLINEAFYDVSHYFADVVTGLAKSLQVYNDTTKKFDDLTGKGKFLQNVLYAISGAGRILLNTFELLFNVLTFPLRVVGQSLGLFSDDVLNALSAPLEVIGTFSEAYAKFTESFTNKLNSVSKSISANVRSWYKEFKETTAIGKIFQKLFDTIEKFKNKITDALAPFTGENGTKGVAQFVKKLKESDSAIAGATNSLTKMGNTVRNTFSNAFSKSIAQGSSKLEAFRDSVVAVVDSLTHGGLSAALNEMFSGVGEIFSNLVETTGTFLENIDVSGLPKDGVVKYLHNLAEAVNDAGSNLKSFNESMRDFAAFVRLNFKENGGVGNLLAVGLGLAVIKSLKQLNAMAKVKIGPIQAFTNSFTGVMNSLSSTLTATAKSMNVNNYKTIAETIAILSGSVIALAAVDPDRLRNATIVISILGGVMALMMNMVSSKFIFNAASVKGSVKSIKNFTAIAASLVSAAAIIGSMVAAYAVVSKVDITDMPKKLAMFGALVAGTMLLVIAMTKLNNVVNKGSIMSTASMFGLIKSITVLSIAFVAISKVNSEGLGKKVFLFLILVGMFEALIYALANIKEASAIKGMVGVLAIAGAIGILSVAFMLLSKVKVDGMTDTVLKMMVVIGLLWGLLMLIGTVGSVALSAAGSILMITAAIALLAIDIKLLSKLSKAEIIKGMDAIASMVLCFSLLMVFSKFSGEHAHKAALAILAMGGALLMLSVAAAILSLIKPEALARSVIAVDALLLAMSVMIYSTKYLSMDAHSVKALQMMIVMIAVLAGSIGALAMLNPEQLYASVLSLVTVIAMVSLLIKTVSALPKEFNIAPLIMLTIIIGALAGSIYLLARLDATNVASAGVALATSIAAFALVAKILNGVKLDAKALGVAILLALVMSALEVPIFLLTKMDVARAIPAIEALSVLMVVFSGMALALGVLGSVAPQAMIGATALIGIIAILGVGLAAIGWLNDKIPGLKEFIDKGVPLISSIAGALGSAVGSFIAGFGSSVTSGLATAGNNLKVLTDALLPVLDSVKTLDKNAISGVNALGKILLALAGIEVGDALSKFLVGSTNIDSTVDDLKKLVNGLIDVANGAESLTDDSVARIKMVSKALTAITDVMQNLPKEGGVAQFLGGTKSFSTLTSELKPLIDAVASVCGKNEGLNQISYQNIEKISYVADAMDEFAELAQSVSANGGILQAFTGTKNIDRLGEQFASLAQSVASANSVEGLDAIDPKRIQKVSEAAKSIASLSEEDIESLSKFTSMMSLYNNVDGEAAKSAGGGKKKGNALGDALSQIGDLFNSLSEKLKPLASGGLDLIKKAFAALKEVGSSLADIGKVSVGNISKFASNLPALGDSLKQFADNVAGVSVENINKAKTAMEKAVTTAKTAVENSDLGAAASNLSSSFKSGVGNVDISSSFTKAISKAQGAIKSKASALKSSGSDIAKQFKSGFESVSLYNSGQNTAAGAIKGINSKKSDVYRAGYNLGKEAKRGYDNAQSIESPSREMMKSGKFTVAGVVLGMKKKFKEAYNTGTGLATNINTGFKDSISLAANAAVMAVGDDYVPTIRPVVDMGGINEGVSMIDAMFSREQAMQISGKMSAQANQVSELEQLKKSLVSGVEKAMSSVVDALDEREKEFNVHVHTNIDGREVAKATAPFTNQELNKITTRTNRALGLV